jgi:addiction module RelE/StbE family toxin
VATVVWSRQALNDVARIAGYIANDNPVAAARVARELLIAGDSLAVFPRRGRPSSLPGRRELVAVRPYVLVYRILPDETVDILRIWHAAQDRSDYF